MTRTTWDQQGLELGLEQRGVNVLSPPIIGSILQENLMEFEFIPGPLTEVPKYSNFKLKRSNNSMLKLEPHWQVALTLSGCPSELVSESMSGGDPSHDSEATSVGSCQAAKLGVLNWASLPSLAESAGSKLLSTPLASLAASFQVLHFSS